MRKPLKNLTLVFGMMGQILQGQTITKTFGTETNAFTIDFVQIGNPGNAADTTGFGSVGYVFNVGKYEISREIIEKANRQGGLSISLRDMSMFTPDSNNPKRPASGIDWYEAARFVNWLNIIAEKQQAYNTDSNGNFINWSTSESSSSNQFRHKNAYYFLPNEDEWYKAAYYNSNQNAYYRYPTSSNNQPAWVSSGESGAVYHVSGPADINSAGALSPYGTMAQGGNLSEWMETAFDLTGNQINENRAYRGGSFISIEVPSQTGLESESRGSLDPVVHSEYLGFRIAMVPEPSALSLLAVGLGGLAMIRRRRS